MSESITICLEFELAIEYIVSSKHIPATQRDPAEGPELEITSVKLGNTEIMHELSAADMNIIIDHCWDHAQDSLMAEEAAHGDYLYEQEKDRRMGL